MSPEELAAALGIHPATLLRWHNQKIGPPRTKIGRTILYSIAQAESYLKAKAK